ncbi:MAG: FAD-dependent oxidoreductase [Gemmatimonadetes bacterium]|nr:FAD-dependent oxidoreductase [Gemmatimonadota bacterium]
MTERYGEKVQPAPDAAARPRLVLAGLGHSHLFVLEAARQGRLPACDLVVCTGEARHVYSGMVPGWLAGQYTIDELSIDVAAAVRAAGGTLVPAHVTGIDPRARTLTLADGNTVPYDVCSIAVGSQVSGKAIPGVAEHAVAVKPLAAIRTIGERLDALARSSGGQVVVVGGGMAGVELALALRTRANGDASRGAPAGTLEGTPGGQSVRVSLVSRDTVLASDRHPRVSRRLERVCEARGIELRLATTPVQLDAGRITLQHAGEQQRRRADLVVWATGEKRRRGWPRAGCRLMRAASCWWTTGCNQSAIPASLRLATRRRSRRGPTRPRRGVRRAHGAAAGARAGPRTR